MGGPRLVGVDAHEDIEDGRNVQGQRIVVIMRGSQGIGPPLSPPAGSSGGCLDAPSISLL